MTQQPQTAVPVVTQAHIDAAREAINEAAITSGAIYSDKIIRAALEAAFGVTGPAGQTFPPKDVSGIEGPSL